MNPANAVHARIGNEVTRRFRPEEVPIIDGQLLSERIGDTYNPLKPATRRMLVLSHSIH